MTLRWRSVLEIESTSLHSVKASTSVQSTILVSYFTKIHQVLLSQTAEFCIMTNAGNNHVEVEKEEQQPTIAKNPSYTSP